LIAINWNRANYIAGVEIMNDAARVTYMTLPRIICRNLDANWRCALRAKLHAGFLKMGGDMTA